MSFDLFQSTQIQTVSHIGGIFFIIVTYTVLSCKHIFKLAYTDFHVSVLVDGEPPSPLYLSKASFRVMFLVNEKLMCT